MCHATGGSPPPACLFFSDGTLVKFFFNFKTARASTAQEVFCEYLAVPASSASPERLFSSVGLVKSVLWGRPKFWTPPWLTWCGLNKHPKLNLKVSKRKSTITQTYTHYTCTRHYICNKHKPIFVTDRHIYRERFLYTYSALTVPHTLRSLPTFNQLFISTVYW